MKVSSTCMKEKKQKTHPQITFVPVLFLKAKSFPIYSTPIFHQVRYWSCSWPTGQYSVWKVQSGTDVHVRRNQWTLNSGRQTCFILSICCLSFQQLHLNFVGFHSVLSTSSFCSLAWSASKSLFPFNLPKYYQDQSLPLSSCTLSALPGRRVQRTASQSTFYK